MRTFTEEAMDITVTLSARSMGRDLAVCVMGGEAPHIGAVALAQSRPSLDSPERVSASCSVITLTGHKEDQLARKVALSLSAALDCVVSVACGIHVDDIEPAAIEAVVSLVDRLTERCVAAYLADQKR